MHLQGPDLRDTTLRINYSMMQTKNYIIFKFVFKLYSKKMEKNCGVCTCVCLYVGVHACVCMWVYVFIYAHVFVCNGAWKLMHVIVNLNTLGSHVFGVLQSFLLHLFFIDF